MVRNRGHEVKVGVFVAAGLAVLVLFVVVLTGVGLGGEEVAFRVRFADVAGLENGSVVRLGGLKVGRVETVGISAEDPSQMEALIRVKKGVPVRETSRAQVTAVGLTGAMYLSLSLGKPGSPLLEPGAVIQGEEAASFQDVINQAKGMAGKMEGILGGLGKTAELLSAEAKSLIQDVRGKMRKVLAATDRVLQRVEGMLNVENERRINRFLTSLARAADHLDRRIGPLIQNIDSALARARESLGRVDGTVDAFGRLAGDASGFVADAKRSLKKVDGFLAHLDKAGEEMGRVVARGKSAIDRVAGAVESQVRGVRADLGKEIGATGSALRKEVSSLGGRARASLDGLSKDLGAALGAIEGVAKEVDGILKASGDNLGEAIRNIRGLTKRVNDALRELSGGGGGGEIRGAAQEVRLALRRAHSLMRQLDEMVGSNREDIHVIIGDLRDTASNLADFTTTLREQPATVIFRRPARPREFGE
ncbi:MAG: MlaD family protein [bacterium]